MKKLSQHPCPICRKITIIVGQASNGKKIGSCGCSWRFKRTRSQKEAERNYVRTVWGLEKR
jgi:hypothetical protein